MVITSCGIGFGGVGVGVGVESLQSLHEQADMFFPVPSSMNDWLQGTIVWLFEVMLTALSLITYLVPRKKY